MNSKAILVFKLPEQADDFKHAMNGYEYKLEIEYFYQYLRNSVKYESFDSERFAESFNLKKLSKRDLLIMSCLFSHIKDMFVNDCLKGLAE